MNAPPKLPSLDSLTFDNRYLDVLPADPEIRNFPRQVLGAYYSRVTPAKVRQPQLVTYSKDVAALLDLPEPVCEADDFAQVFAGNRLAKGMEPHATCYGGHQFGHWAGQLGDGRAINLGDVINHNQERWTLQLKGAGLTPYSRTADGLAVLRSSVREFLCSEAMHHLGVPTTRALSLVLTGEQVVRDMFYNGNPNAELGAVVCRVAPSFIRFGSFQIHAARGDLALLKKLTDYTIKTHFPHLGNPSKDAYLAWFEEVCRTTAQMIVHWQRVGFVHGVMNTDNMSILGLTIDYGPYGWLDNYDPDWTPNTTDREHRRYRYSNQPACAFWNLGQLANALFPLIGEVKPLQDALDRFNQFFGEGWNNMMLQKLGLNHYNSETDDSLFADLLTLLNLVETDMTIFFRQLAWVDLAQNAVLPTDIDTMIAPLADAYYTREPLSSDYVMQLVNWLTRYRQRLQRGGVSEASRQKTMCRANPKYVLRNYLAQLAIDKAVQGDFSGIAELLAILRNPYDEQLDHAHYAVKRPDWARHRPGCSTLSCSS